MPTDCLTYEQLRPFLIVASGGIGAVTTAIVIIMMKMLSR